MVSRLKHPNLFCSVFGVFRLSQEIDGIDNELSSERSIVLKFTKQDNRLSELNAGPIGVKRLREHRGVHLPTLVRENQAAHISLVLLCG